MTGVIEGLEAQRAAIKAAIKQTIERQLADAPADANAPDTDQLWRLQRRLEEIHTQIAAYLHAS